MNRSETPRSMLLSSTGDRVALLRQVLGVILLAVLVTGTFAGCAHRDDPDKKKKKHRPKERDPIEQKVFYDGWGWRH